MAIFFSSSFLLFCFFSCCIIQAFSDLSINYTLLTSNLMWHSYMFPIYPVLVNNLTVLGNEHFSLSFGSIPGPKQEFGFGIYMRVQNASEPQIIWNPGLNVTEGSRVELNSSGIIALKDPDGNVRWSVGPNVYSFELSKQDGNLKFYDANETVVWQSGDYATDILLMGKNFTKLSAGNATAVWEGGSLMISKSSTQNQCKIRTAGGVKSQLRFFSGRLFLRSFNVSDFPIQTDILIYLGQDVSESSFMRLHKDGYFIVYTLENGKWNSYPACCSGTNYSAEFSNCLEAGIDTGWKTKLPAWLLVILVFLMSCLQLLWIFTKMFRLKSLLLTIIICSIAATSLVLVKLHNLLYYPSSSYANHYYISYSFYYGYYTYSSYTYSYLPPMLTAPTFAIELIILQTITIFLLRLLTNSPRSSKTITSLILLNMAAILSSYTTSAAPSLVPENNYVIDTYISYIISLSIYPLSVANTICLIIIRLPGPRWCNRKGRISFIVFLNFFIAASSAASVITSLILFKSATMIIFIVMTLILILSSSWACYTYYGKSIVAKLQSMKLSLQIMQKVLLWILLGRRSIDTPDIEMSLSSFSYLELEVVTNNFSKLIGKGGFGGVYEGTLLDGKKVAVKKLESNSQGMQEFKSEIETLGKIHHVNLVQLLGFCAEGPYKLLVYEFLSNGSLEKWIFHDDIFLDWTKRMKIIMGTAQGLAYLHQECEPKILHLDVKPQNILLDETFHAKVSDFGLCRLMPGDQTSIILTRMMGTLGYLPPEWVNGSVSEKNDVYSFGIVMLEVLSGHRSYGVIEEGSSSNCLQWAQKSMENGSLVSPRLSTQEDYNEEEMKRVAQVALLCTHEDPNMRPTMKMVVKMLEGDDDVFKQPGCLYDQIDEEYNLYSIQEEQEEEEKCILQLSIE